METIEMLLYAGYSLSIWHIQGAKIGAELWYADTAVWAEGATVAETIDNIVRQFQVHEQSTQAPLAGEEEA